VWRLTELLQALGAMPETRVAGGITSASRRPRQLRRLSNRAIAVILGLLVTVTGIFVLGFGGTTTFSVRTDAELDRALARATGGEAIVIRPGTYGLHYLRKSYAPRLTIRGADRRGVRVRGFSTLANATASTVAANIRITRLTISGVDEDRDGVRINQGSHDIEIADVTIAGGRHCIDINAYPYTGVAWPYNITVRNADLSGSKSDLVHVTGGRAIVFQHNFIHDPQDNPDDHVDGIQSTASYDLKIVANSFTEPVAGATGFNQAIILGRADPYDQFLVVRNSYVANNLIYGWRGSGILLAGTQTTWVVNNTSMPYEGQEGFVTADKSPSTSGGTAEAWYNADLRVWNNIFNKVSADSRPAPVFESNNLVTEAATGYGTNSITGRARFVTTSSSSPERYQLKRTSPAVDSGVTTADGMTPRTDLDGRTRTGPPDRGAREYVAAAAP
jgi:Right handed beta helix region